MEQGGVQSEEIFSPWFRNMLQQETEEVMESEDGRVEFETPTDDEEVTIPSQDKYKKVPDIPNSDIRDEQIHNEKTYGAHAWGSPATDRQRAPSGDRQSST